MTDLPVARPPDTSSTCPTCLRRLPAPPDPTKPKSRGSWGKILGPLPQDEKEREAFDTLIDACRDKLVAAGLDANNMRGGYYVLSCVIVDWLNDSGVSA